MYPIRIGTDFLNALPNTRKQYKNRTEVWAQVDRTKREGFSLAFYGDVYHNRATWEEGAPLIFEDVPSIDDVKQAMFEQHGFKSDGMCERMFTALGLDKTKLLDVGSYFSMGYEGKLELTYVPKVRMQRMFAVPYFPNVDPYDKPVIPAMNISAGRFFKKLFPEAADTEIEDMVDRAKTFFYDAQLKIEEVSDERILWAYLQDNYDRGFDLGSLANSCMRYEEYQDRIQFFVEEPKVSCLVAHHNVGGVDKVVGRVLIWTLDSGKRAMEYMYCGGAVRKMFEDYAKKHDIESDYSYLTENGEVTLAKWPKHGIFPSLDSFYHRDEKALKIYGYNSRASQRRY